MRFLASNLRSLCVLAAIANVVGFALLSYLGFWSYLLPGPELPEIAAEKFRDGSHEWRIFVAFLGLVLGFVISVVSLGPIALLFEIRDHLLEIRSRIETGVVVREIK